MTSRCNSSKWKTGVMPITAVFFIFWQSKNKNASLADQHLGKQQSKALCILIDPYFLGCPEEVFDEQVAEGNSSGGFYLI